MKTAYEKLLCAEVVCRDCGDKYGKYSVGCSSVWLGTCDVCDEHKPVTEVRDWGYLTKGINELKPRRPAEPFSNLTENFTPERKAKIKEQSKEVADYMKSQEPTLTEREVASYERGDITLKLTEEEVGFLNECLDTLQEFHSTLQPEEDGWRVPEDIALFEQIERKITDLYDNHCVHYSLSPALKKFHELYGTYGTENEQEQAKWTVFRDAFYAGADHANGRLKWSRSSTSSSSESPNCSTTQTTPTTND
jgi:hypothetical protein